MEDDQQQQPQSLKEWISKNTLKQFPEYPLAEACWVVANRRADEPVVSKKDVHEKLAATFGDGLAEGFYDHAKKDQRVTIKPMVGGRFVVLFAGESLISCESGKDPSLHPDNLIFIGNRDTGIAGWAIVRSWEEGTILLLNRAENYIVTASNLLEKNAQTDHIEFAFTALYKIVQSRFKICREHSIQDIQEYFAAIDNDEKPPFPMGGMLIPTALLFESSENLAKIAQAKPRGRSTVFDIQPKKQGVSKPRKRTSSSSSSSTTTTSSSSAKEKTETATPKAPKKGKGKGASKPSVKDAAKHANLLSQIGKIIQDSGNVRKEYVQVFFDHVLKKGSVAPDSHKLEKPKRLHRRTESLYRGEVSAMTCAERMISAIFQVMDGTNPEIEDQVNACVANMEKKLVKGDNHKYNLLGKPLGVHYVGDSQEPVAIQHTRDLYVIFYVLANQIIPKVVETVERALNDRMMRKSDEIADLFQKNYKKYMESLENELAELQTVVSTSEARLQEIVDSNERAVQDLSDDLARTKVENSELRERLAELEGRASSSTKKRSLNKNNDDDEEPAAPKAAKKQKIKQDLIKQTLSKTIGEVTTSASTSTSTSTSKSIAKPVEDDSSSDSDEEELCSDSE